MRRLIAGVATPYNWVPYLTAPGISASAELRSGLQTLDPRTGDPNSVVHPVFPLLPEFDEAAGDTAIRFRELVN